MALQDRIESPVSASNGRNDMSKPKMVPLREVLEVLTKHAKVSRHDALMHVRDGSETGRWDAFRLRHYAASLEDARDILHDYYGGFGA